MPARTKPTLGRDMASMMHWREGLGDYLRDARLARGLTQDELGDLVGIKSKQMISAWETGRATVPPERITVLAEVLRIPTKQFAKAILRWTNPWIYAALYGVDEALSRELASSEERINVRKGPRTGPR